MDKNMCILLVLLFIIVSCTLSEPSYNPIDKKATKETKQLYNRLFTIRDIGIMVGHQDALAYGHSWYKEKDRSDVKDVVGDYPAVIGWELGHIELDAEFNLDSVYFTDIRKYIKETQERGGITTVSWHGDNIATGNTSWDCNQDTIVSSVLPNGIHHNEYLTWLNRLGDFFLSLKDESGNFIPIVFRMYHEHTGGWFWWGNKQCSPAEYKSLWIMTVDFLREKGVHNLIYAYSPATVKSEEEFFERYPGDDYVDILGYDCYTTNVPSVLEQYKKDMDFNLSVITRYAQKSDKIAIIGETGMESIPNTSFFTDELYPIISKYNIAWVLFWRNAWEVDKPHHYYIPYKGHKSSSDFMKFTSEPNILMNNDIN